MPCYWRLGSTARHDDSHSRAQMVEERGNRNTTFGYQRRLLAKAPNYLSSRRGEVKLPGTLSSSP